MLGRVNLRRVVRSVRCGKDVMVVVVLVFSVWVEGPWLLLQAGLFISVSL